MKKNSRAHHWLVMWYVKIQILDTLKHYTFDDTIFSYCCHGSVTDYCVLLFSILIIQLLNLCRYNDYFGQAIASATDNGILRPFSIDTQDISRYDIANALWGALEEEEQDTVDGVQSSLTNLKL